MIKEIGIKETSPDNRGSDNQGSSVPSQERKTEGSPIL